jgi:hypothetical protein
VHGVVQFCIVMCKPKQELVMHSKPVVFIADATAFHPAVKFIQSLERGRHMGAKHCCYRYFCAAAADMTCFWRSVLLQAIPVQGRGYPWRID